MKKYAVEGLDGYPNELAHKLDAALELNADLLAALKELFAAYESMSNADSARLADPMFRLTVAVTKAKQAIADAEAKNEI